MKRRDFFATVAPVMGVPGRVPTSWVVEVKTPTSPRKPTETVAQAEMNNWPELGLLIERASDCLRALGYAAVTDWQATGAGFSIWVAKRPRRRIRSERRAHGK